MLLPRRWAAPRLGPDGSGVRWSTLEAVNLHCTFGSETPLGSLTPLAESWRLSRFFLLLLQSQPFSLFRDEQVPLEPSPVPSLGLACNTEDERVTKTNHTTSCVLPAGGSLLCLSRHFLKRLFGSSSACELSVPSEGSVWLLAPLSTFQGPNTSWTSWSHCPLRHTRPWDWRVLEVLVLATAGSAAVTP